MEKEKARKAHMTKKLDEHQLSFNFIEAVDGRLLDEKRISQITLKNKMINSIGREMSKGEIGCVMSHLHVYQKMVDKGIEQAIIFEDDIDINYENFDEIIDFLVKENSNKPKVHLLTKTISYLSKNTKKINSLYNIAHIVQALSAAGYVVNQAAARQMLSINKKAWILADDWARYKMHTGIDILCVFPPIVKENPSTSNQSSIIGERDKMIKKRTIRYILSRNKNKVIADLKKYFWFIPFKGYVREK
jgi:glycosyl transferase family 25